MDIGPCIREARQRARLSQEELAAEARINRTYLSQLENGHSSPTLEVLNRIALALGLKPAALLPAAEDAPESAPYYEIQPDADVYQGLQELLDDERTRLLIKPTVDEIEMLKGIRFLNRHSPSKELFIEILLDYRREPGETERGRESSDE